MMLRREAANTHMCPGRASLFAAAVIYHVGVFGNKGCSRLASASIVSDSCEGTHLEAVVRPTAKLHDTRLLVKREVLDVDLARALVDGGWLPLHPACVVEGGFRGQRHLEVAIRTENLIYTHKYLQTSH